MKAICNYCPWEFEGEKKEALSKLAVHVQEHKDRGDERRWASREARERELKNIAKA